MTEYDDDTLEQIMREGLEFRAGSAATALADPSGRDPHAVRRAGRRPAAGPVTWRPIRPGTPGPRA